MLRYRGFRDGQMIAISAQVAHPAALRRQLRQRLLSRAVLYVAVHLKMVCSNSMQ